MPTWLHDKRDVAEGKIEMLHCITLNCNSALGKTWLHDSRNCTEYWWITLTCLNHLWNHHVLKMFVTFSKNQVLLSKPTQILNDDVFYSFIFFVADIFATDMIYKQDCQKKRKEKNDKWFSKWLIVAD